MRLRRRQVEIAATLIVAAAVVYVLRWILFPSESFHDEMLRYLVDDIWQPSCAVPVARANVS